MRNFEEFPFFPQIKNIEEVRKMEHEALIEVVDRLIASGMGEIDALKLVTQFLWEEAEDFIRVRDDLVEPDLLN